MNKDTSTVLTLPSTASRRAPVEAVAGEVRGPKGKIEEKCADLYSIIRATELVEELYYENMTESYEYTVQCKKLILQFDITLSDLIEKKAVSSMEEFFDRYKIDCPAAKNRLLKKLPATEETESRSFELAAKTAQLFVTVMDVVKLNTFEVDQLSPYIRDLVNALKVNKTIPSSFAGTSRLEVWDQKLKGMKAADSITEADGRQLYHDLETSNDEFMNLLQRK